MPRGDRMWERLKQRPLNLFLAYRALALTWAFMPFQVIFLQQRGLSLAEIFDLNVVFSLATVALEVPTGIFADRNGRRVALSLAGVAMVVGCVMFSLGGGFWIYALCNALFALSMTLSSGADSAYLYDFLRDRGASGDELDRAYKHYEGLCTAAKGVGNLVGVLVGGVVFAFAPIGVFILTALVTGLAAVLALALPERPHAPRAASAADDLRRVWFAVSRSGRLRWAIAFGAVTFVLLRLSLFTDQPHLEVHLSRANAGYLAQAAALLAAAKEIGAAALSWASGGITRRFRIRFLLGALALACIAVYAIMGFGQAVPDIACMVLLASAQGLFSPLMRSFLNGLIRDSSDRATLLSFESMARRVLFAAASPLFGRAVEASSLHAAFTGTAWVATIVYVVLGATAVGLFPVFRRARPRDALASVA